MKVFVAALILAALGGALVWQRSAVSELRNQNDSLRSEKREAERLAAENRALQFQAPADLRTAGSEQIELLRLRNEIGQLRRARQEAERLRAANQRMAEELHDGK